MSSPPRKMTISERRATYPLQERLKIYGPDTMAQRISDQEKYQGKLLVHGVNILNKTSLDSDTVMKRIKQRRETHNRVERRRRDMLNGLVNELAEVIPIATENAEKCHRAKILRQAIDYIRQIQEENNSLRSQLGFPQVARDAIVEMASDSSTAYDSDDREQHHLDEPRTPFELSQSVSPASFVFCFDSAQDNALPIRRASS
ncbi:hypothetical protein DFQ28_002406 [Apophysomyces sp. BC1034]|nr:hypothetical protein DFQ30_002791 [Apophysomyces sp. BC1015]KAG0179710.1 hypothetical protein DFQ29_001750 [Apophysomyces sp. BC1021]KAG0190187.1 hypothetical protein DFQ28_002406 [Apophysomyces sp. BC1034]